MKTKQQQKDEARKEYAKIKNSAYEEYEKIENPAYEKYINKLKEIDNL